MKYTYKMGADCNTNYTSLVYCPNYDDNSSKLDPKVLKRVVYADVAATSIFLITIQWVKKQTQWTNNKGD